MKRFIFAVALLVAGCVSGGPKPFTDSETEAVLSGGQALVAIDSGNFNFENGARMATNPVIMVSLVNAQTQDVVLLETSAPSIGRAGRPGHAVVDPGTYVLAKGFAFTGTLQPALPLFSRWFAPIEIDAGEVIDLGMLEATVLPRIKRTDNVARKAIRFMVDTREDHYYLTYNFSDEASVRVANRLTEEAPQLAARLEHRPPEPLLDEEAFAAIVTEAYARKPDGSWPTKEESFAHIDQELKALLERE